MFSWEAWIWVCLYVCIRKGMVGLKNIEGLKVLCGYAK